MPETARRVLPASGQGQRHGNQPGCEWNPDAGAPALPTSDHHLYALATWEVAVPEDGPWRLCNTCSQRPPFKGRPRVRLPKVQA